MLTMQDALLALTRYWSEQGALLAQPMNTEVGAGTLNPATFLRVLGPEPWRVAYVEPSVRPDDSRYGDNPNRLQTHTQFQVVLKPEPGIAQQLYLGSLAALGIDVAAHDVRFVEDDWASPALGAWGLGWEVWLDGLEITQFTYFQQAGGSTLDPVSVEITYGVERILMALQGVDHVMKIAYAPDVTYGEVFGPAEYEMSRYYLDDADTRANRDLFELYAGEARRMLDARLPVPAHSYVLKCSHAFNVLDARGAVSTTERARAFARMRGLAHEVATLWTQRREELGWPLGTSARPVAPALPQTLPAGPAGPAPLAFEIGVEELPPTEVRRAVEAVRSALESGLDRAGLRHGGVTVHGSPRRVVALVEEVAPRQDDAERTVRGPRVSAAYGPDGAPTKALAGFARGQGVEVSELSRVEVTGVEHVALVRHVPGRTAVELLAELLPGVVAGLRGEKNMRWEAPGLSYSRPIRWLLALLGDTVLPFAVSSLASGGSTRVRRTAAEPVVPVPSADALVGLLAAHGITVDAGVRRAQVVAGAVELGARAGGSVDVAAEARLVDEITDLVEHPTPILGRFDERYLELPAEVLTTVMRKHQRYLPVRAADGGLLPAFVAVADGAVDVELVRAGNEAVLRARYEDAAFFFRADLAVPPERMRAGLAALTFEEQLGSVADRAARIAAVADDLAGAVGLPAQERETLRRAGALAKFDLASSMVTELTSLAGTMAAEYARRAGEPEPVATALAEMELPRSAGDRLPGSAPGALLALADRFDLLAGLFARGAAPTGSSDPFGLRRAAAGVLVILRARPDLAAVTVPGALAAAGARQPVGSSAEVLAEATEFVARRYEQQLLDAGADPRLVRAVLPLADRPARADAILAELAGRLDDPQFGRLVQAVQRVGRIVPAGTAPRYDAALLTDPAEQGLHDALRKVRAEVGGTPADVATLAGVAGPLVAAIDRFFVDVLVMADDPAVRANRLGLLAAVRDLTAGLLDWSVL